MRGLSLGLGLLVWVTAVQVARAQAADTRAAARLEHTRDGAAARCPDAEALKEAVSRELGYRVFEREPATRVVSVAIAAGKSRGLRARIEVRDTAGKVIGERAIESPSSDCAELASALTLAVGLALDPSYLLAKREPAPPPAAPCPAPAPCPVCPPQQVTDDERPPELAAAAEIDEPSTFRGVIAGVGLGLGLAALPAPSGGGIAHVAATWERASLGLEAVLHPGARGGELASGEVSDPIEAELLRGQLVACGRLPIAPQWSFDGCGLGALGALRGRGAGTGSQDVSLAASAGVRAGVQLALSEIFSAHARIDGHANLVRTTLNVDDMPAWSSPPFWAELSVVLGVRLF